MDDREYAIGVAGIVVAVVVGLALLVSCNAAGCGEAAPQGFVTTALFGGPFSQEVLEETHAWCAAELALESSGVAPDIKSIPGDVRWFDLFRQPDTHAGDVLLFGGWASYDKKHSNATHVLVTNDLVVDTDPDVCPPPYVVGACNIVHEFYQPIRVLNASIPDGGRVILNDKVVVCGVFEGVGDGIGYDDEPIVRALVIYVEGQT